MSRLAVLSRICGVQIGDPGEISPAPRNQKLTRKTAKPQPVIFQRLSDAVPTRNRKRKHCLQMSDPRGAVSDVDAVRDIRKDVLGRR